MKQDSPMNGADYLLSHLAQECSEVAIRCTKAQHFGLDETQPEQSLTNRQRIMEEISDLYAMVEFMQDVGILPRFAARDFQARISAKHRKAEHFRGYSRELGRLSGEVSERERAARIVEAKIAHLANVGISDLNWNELESIANEIRDSRY